MKPTSYSAKEIAKVIPGNHRLAHPELVISHLLIDSRRAHQVSNSLFFALPGDFRDGHQYIKELYRKGLRNFVVSQPIAPLENANIFHCENVLEALQKLAQNQREKTHIPVIAITGSNGKTIVKEWLFQLLREHLTIVRSPKSYNSKIGVPLSVFRMNTSHNIGIFEAGISRKNEMKTLQKIIQPTVGVFTNIGQSHQENFSSLSEKVIEKMNLFTGVDTLIFNCDVDLITNAANEILPRKKQLRWGASLEADVHITLKKIEDQYTDIEAFYLNKKHQLRIPFTNSASIENALHCWVFMLYKGLKATEIQNKFSVLEPIAMRLEQLSGIGNSIILNDSYNADQKALEIALHHLDTLQRAKKTVILSDILESGESAESLYQVVNTRLINHKIQRFIGIGPTLFAYQHLFNFPEQHFYPSTQEFIDEFDDHRFKDEAVLIKGARKFEFEKITDKLTLKTHQTYLEINLDALKHNLHFFRDQLAPSVKTMVMVKAFGYGAGGPEVARLLANEGVDYLGVAYADEGIAIRNAGITMPIIVMNASPHSFSAMIAHNLEPEIYSLEVFNAYTKVLNDEAPFNSGYKIHVKVDTGMNRLGFRPEEIDLFLSALKKEKAVTVTSVFSHLAGSDSDEFNDFTQQQIEKFTAVSAHIEQTLGYTFMRHISNSAAIERFPNAQFSMVRLGLGLYGISAKAKNQIQLQTVSSLHSIVVQVKKVPKGESIGYSRKYFASGDMKIAIIPVGYADGLDRKLGNGNGFVFISGAKRPIVGNICMDLIMVDVTGLSTAVNDPVELFGTNISISELADQAQTIGYEILTSIPQRVKRVYTTQGS